MNAGTRVKSKVYGYTGELIRKIEGGRWVVLADNGVTVEAPEGALIKIA